MTRNAATVGDVPRYCLIAGNLSWIREVRLT